MNLADLMAYYNVLLGAVESAARNVDAKLEAYMTAVQSFNEAQEGLDVLMELTGRSADELMLPFIEQLNRAAFQLESAMKEYNQLVLKLEAIHNFISDLIEDEVVPHIDMPDLPPVIEGDVIYFAFPDGTRPGYPVEGFEI
jgi:hypothetical protein